MNYNPPGSSVHRISQARMLEWVAISFSRRSSLFRDQTRISCIGRQILYCWTSWEALSLRLMLFNRNIMWVIYIILHLKNEKWELCTIFYLTQHIQNIILSYYIGKHVINRKSFKLLITQAVLCSTLWWPRKEGLWGWRKTQERG